MRCTIATVLAALVLASLAGVAGAERGIGLSPTSTTITLSGLEIEGGIGTPWRCNVTIDAAFHERTAKVAGTLLGLADLAVGTGACTEGDFGLLVGGRRVTGAQGPYHVTYEAFEGSLPNIGSISFTLNDVVFWITLPGIECLTDGAVDISLTTSGGNPATGVRLDPASVPLTGEFLCIFAGVELIGDGTLSNSVRMTLV